MIHLQSLRGPLSLDDAATSVLLMSESQTAAAAHVHPHAGRLVVDLAQLALFAIPTRKSPIERPEAGAVPHDRCASVPRHQTQPVQMHHLGVSF
jgi:hypothetical protein